MTTSRSIAIESPARGAAALSLLIWLAVQMTVLALAANQTQFSEQFPRPAERMAAWEMMFTQIIFAALLFPILMRSTTSALLCGAAGVLMAMFAGFLSALPQRTIALHAAYLSLWMLALWAVHGLTMLNRRRRMWAMLGSALAAAWSAGGAMMWYLQAEGNYAAGASWKTSAGQFGPAMAGLKLLSDPVHAHSAFIPVGATLVATTTVFAAVKLSSILLRRQVIHRSSTATPPSAA